MPPRTQPAQADTAIDALARRALALTRPGERTLVGIAGSPGSGKTTLATTLANHVNAHSEVLAAHLPMDGFHLANATLDRLDRRGRKGAIDTFDGWGFVALLERLRVETAHTVYAPGFDRTVDEPVAGDIAIEPATQLIFVEGNYLLVDEGPWARVNELLDESWFCETPEATRVQRLVERHVRHGRSKQAARDWATQVDGENAKLIEATMPRADLIVR